MVGRARAFLPHPLGQGTLTEPLVWLRVAGAAPGIPSQDNTKAAPWEFSSMCCRQGNRGLAGTCSSWAGEVESEFWAGDHWAPWGWGGWVWAWNRGTHLKVSTVAFVQGLEELLRAGHWHPHLLPQPAREVSGWDKALTALTQRVAWFPSSHTSQLPNQLLPAEDSQGAAQVSPWASGSLSVKWEQ